jgi:hypothetical protein
MKMRFSALSGAVLAFGGSLVLATAAHASTVLPLGAAANFAVLYEGTGGHNLGVTNDAISGNVGVGGTGAVQFNGPGAINGVLDFSAANTGQFHNTNGSNIGPTSVTYSAPVVATALSDIASLSSGVTGGANIAFTNAGETINESSGVLETVLGVNVRVFNVTAYSANNASVLTIVGDGSGAPVVFDFGFNSNVNLGGSVVFSGSGLTSGDQVLWNFQTTGKNISLTNNGETFRGVILAPSDAISLSNTNLYGRVLGGGSSDMQIVSGANVYAPIQPPGVPEPAAWALMLAGFGGIGALARARRRRIAAA